MAAEDYGEVLLRVADQLCRELGHVDPETAPQSRSGSAEKSATPQVLGSGDAALAASLDIALAKFAAALGSGPNDSPPPPVRAALEGIELVVRGELVSGNASRLPQLMPSFIFLVALAIVEQDRALELSRRASELLDEILGA